jgi:hypothetical protein
MATQLNSTAKNDREALTEASLEGCYLETLLSVIEDTFEEIDHLCDMLGETSGLIRAKARLGLNITYMAQDKSGLIKKLTDDVEKELWLAERLQRNEARAEVQ